MKKNSICDTKNYFQMRKLKSVYAVLQHLMKGFLIMNEFFYLKKILPRYLDFLFLMNC